MLTHVFDRDVANRCPQKVTVKEVFEIAKIMKGTACPFHDLSIQTACRKVVKNAHQLGIRVVARRDASQANSAT